MSRNERMLPMSGTASAWCRGMHPIVYGIKRAFLSSTTFLRRKLRRAFGLTQARFDVLYLVHKGHEDQLEIRRKLGLTSSTISEMLQTLEKLLLVTRKTKDTDRRARVVHLTAEGKRRTVACIEAWLTHRAGLRMVRNAFDWNKDPDHAFRQMDDFESRLLMLEEWFITPVASARLLYPGFHPDD